MSACAVFDQARVLPVPALASLHKNSQSPNYFGISPPPPTPPEKSEKKAQNSKGSTLKEVTQLASPPFHIQISTRRQMALVGDHAALQLSVNGSG